MGYNNTADSSDGIDSALLAELYTLTPDSSLLTSDRVGEILRRIRVRKHCSQLMLAEDSDTNTSYYCTIEAGNTRISLHKFVALCTALSAPPSLVVAIVGRCPDLDDGLRYLESCL